MIGQCPNTPIGSISIFTLQFGLIHPKPTITEGGEEWANSVIRRFLRLAFHNSRRARGARAGGARGAFRGFRAFHFRTPGTGARRAFTLGFVALRAIQNNRLGLGDAGLQDIVAQVRDRRDLALQHIVAQVRANRAGRDRAFEDILGHVGFAARRARRADGAGLGLRAAARPAASTSATLQGPAGLESLVARGFCGTECPLQDHTERNPYQENGCQMVKSQLHLLY
jgi:hypothetical protein